MKRILAIIVAFCMTLAIAGCSQLEKFKNIELPPLPTQTPVPVQETEPAATAEPEKSDEPVLSDPQCQIIINTLSTKLEEYDPAEGKELILSYSYETPVVYIEGRNEATVRINEIIALLDETHYTGNDHGMGDGTGGFNMMLEQAQDNYAYVVNTGAQGVSLEFTASRTASIGRADDSVLSIIYDDYYFTGGENGKHFTRGYCFDTETGEKLSIEKLSADSQGFASFLVQTMLDMAENMEEISAEIDPAIVPFENREEALTRLMRDGSWYLDNEGLCIFSDASEFNETDSLVFHISYEQLEGKLIDKFIPSARNGEAAMNINYLSEVENGSIEILDRVVADENGEELCISISGKAYDVKLSRVDYTDRFFETAQLWYASYVSDCAVQLVALIPEGMPELMISYNDAQGENHRLLISQSGEDGSLLLVDESIEAVG